MMNCSLAGSVSIEARKRSHSICSSIGTSLGEVAALLASPFKKGLVLCQGLELMR